MKIAVCFAGFLRSFPATIGNWNYRLRDYDCDFYIHSPGTYYAPSQESVHDARGTQIVDSSFVQYTLNSKLKWLNLYEYRSEKFKNVVINCGMPEKNQFDQPIYRILSYQYNIQEVTKMVMTSGISYDYIMLTRADLNLYEDFNFHNLNNNQINYPVYHGLTLQGALKNGIAGVVGTPYAYNDQIFIGKSSHISIFQNIYDSVPNYYNEGISINSETLLGIHCLKNNISFGTNDFVKYDILRFAQQ
jgi:hypothetical protein